MCVGSLGLLTVACGFDSSPWVNEKTESPVVEIVFGAPELDVRLGSLQVT